MTTMLVCRTTRTSPTDDFYQRLWPKRPQNVDSPMNLNLTTEDEKLWEDVRKNRSMLDCVGEYDLTGGSRVIGGRPKCRSKLDNVGEYDLTVVVAASAPK